MKKITLLVSLVLTSVCALAHTEFVSISPGIDTTVENKAVTVTAEFSGVVYCDSILINSGEVSKVIAESLSGTTLSYSLTDDDWGTLVVDGYNVLTLAFAGVKDDDGNYITNEDWISVNEETGGENHEYLGSEGRVATRLYYLVDESETATYIGVEQDPYWWLAQDLFGVSVTALFSKDVDLSMAYAELKFYQGSYLLEDGIVLLSNDYIYGSTNRSGYYAVDINLPAYLSDVYTEENTDKMDVYLYNVKANGLGNPQCLASYDFEFEDDIFSLRVNSRGIDGNEEAGIETMSTDIDQTKKSIYSISGVLVKKSASGEDINSLKSGMYVIGMNKVFIP